MRVIYKDSDGERHRLDEPAHFELTGSGQLRVAESPEDEIEDLNPGEWAWYRVENRAVIDG